MHFFQTNFVSPTTYIHKQMVRSVGDLKLPFMVTIPAEQLSPPPIPPPPAPFHEVVIQLLIVNRVKLIPTVRVVQCRNFAESYKYYACYREYLCHQSCIIIMCCFPSCLKMFLFRFQPPSTGCALVYFRRKKTKLGHISERANIPSRVLA